MKTKHNLSRQILISARRFLALTVAALAGCAAVDSLNAQTVIAGWNLSSDTSNASANATTVDSNLSGTPVLSMSASFTKNYFNASSGLMGYYTSDTSSGLSAAQSAGTYFEFTLTPAAGKQLEVDSVTVPASRWTWQGNPASTIFLTTNGSSGSSLGFTSPTGSGDAGGWTVTLGSPVISSSPVTFRIYVAENFGWRTVGFNGAAGDSLQVIGSVGNQGVSRATTTTVLGSTPNPSGSGQSVTFTATVKTNGVTATGVTGDMVFKDGGTPVYTNSSPSSGVYTYTTSERV